MTPVKSAALAFFEEFNGVSGRQELEKRKEERVKNTNQGCQT